MQTPPMKGTRQVEFKPRLATLRQRSMAIALATLMPYAHAEEPISTDRPDFVESSNTVGKGRGQIEASVFLERDKSSDSRRTTWSTPTLFRLGVSEDWEVRLESDGRINELLESAGERTTQQGWAGTSLGVKWHMQDNAGMAPNLAWLLHIDQTNGSAAFHSEGIRPSLRAVMEWELPDNWSFGLMPGLAGEKAENQRYTAGILGIVLGKELSESTRVLAELALPHIADSKHGGTQAYLNFAAAWLLSNDIQLDLSVQRGLNDRTADWGSGLGLSVRF